MNLQTATKYFGCQIEVNGQEHTMWGIVPDGVWYTENRTNKVAKWGEWKPILKPLSEITDGDAVEVAKIGGCHYKIHDFIVQAGKELVTVYLNRGSNVTRLKWQHITDFLRSRYYDIDNVLKP